MGLIPRWAIAPLVGAGILFPVFALQAADAPPPPIRAFDIPTIEKLGQEMYSQDQLAWKATDVMLEKRTAAGTKQDGLNGWVSDADGAYDVIRFIHIGKQGPEALYEVKFLNGEQPIFSAPDNPVLNADEMAQYNARTLALKSVSHPCSDRYNTVALKDPESEGWLVWALAATNDPNLMLIGGNYRFTISADGKTIRQTDALSASCLKFDKKEMAKQLTANNALKSAGQLMSHVVSLTPIETHVFDSLTYQTAFEVGTNDGKVWRVDQGHVIAVEQDAPGFDGFAARAMAGIAERCTVVATKQNESPKRYYIAGPTQVINTTEHDAVFTFKAVQGNPVTLPAGEQPDSIVCVRLDLVPSPNDYKVLLAGYGLSIGDRGQGHTARMGKLELANGQFRFTIINGPPMDDTLNARMNARLDGFQKFATAKN